MRRFMLLLIGVGILAGGAGVVGAQEELPEFFAAQVPEGRSITVDGDLGDWGWFPEVAVITPEDQTSQHDIDVVYNPEDYDLRLMFAWSEETNLLYLGMEIFDDILTRMTAPEQAGQWGPYDMVDIYTDADNSGGQYQYGVPDEEVGTTAQQWILNIDEAGQSFGGVLRAQGATWMNVPPYFNQVLTLSEVTGGYRLIWESYIMMYDFLSPEGPDQSAEHDINLGDIVGISWVWEDFDPDYQGYWKLHRPKGAHENADVFPDLEMIGPPTAVENGMWGQVKTLFR